MRSFVRVLAVRPLCAAAVLVVGLGGPALAQLDAVEVCRVEEGAAARITCLEKALCRTLESEGDRNDCLAGLLTEREITPALERRAVADPLDVESRGEDGPRRRFGVFGRGGERDGESEETVVASSSDEASELGSESLPGAREQNETERVRVSAVITSFDYRQDDVLQVELDNGQVWRQLTSDNRRVRLREGDPMQVELWRSGFGGYRMRLVEQGVRLRVERVR